MADQRDNYRSVGVTHWLLGATGRCKRRQLLTKLQLEEIWPVIQTVNLHEWTHRCYVNVQDGACQRVQMCQLYGFFHLSLPALCHVTRDLIASWVALRSRDERLDIWVRLSPPLSGARAAVTVAAVCSSCRSRCVHLLCPPPLPLSLQYGSSGRKPFHCHLSAMGVQCSYGCPSQPVTETGTGSL